MDIEKNTISQDDSTLENFSTEEIKVLNLFFTNTSSSIFFAKNTLPPELVGALSSRYSRSEKSVRRIFLDEFYNTNEFSGFLSGVDKTEDFLGKFLNTDRARNFFKKWLSMYGDDSIAEMGGINVFFEGISNIASNYLESFGLGSFLEKSSRYVSFSSKDSAGKYSYFIPTEIKESQYGSSGESLVNEMFELYSSLQDKYLDYIKKLYPKGEDETDISFNNSRSAKRFDDLRDILPFATRTNVALHVNGRLLEDIIANGIDHPLSEVRHLSKVLLEESKKIVGSFTDRVESPRGKELSSYYRAVSEFSIDNAPNFSQRESDSDLEVLSEAGVELVSYPKDNEINILASLLYDRSSSEQNLDFNWYVNYVISSKDISDLYNKFFNLRYFSGEDREKVRGKKLVGAFKLGDYVFEIKSRGGDYRDLFRHRVVVHQRPKLTTRLGYSLDPDLKESPYYNEVHELFKKIDKFYKSLPEDMINYAEYLIPYAFHQRYLMSMSAWEAYHLIELRSGPQGRSHYREIVQKMSDLLKGVHPNIFSGLKTDYNKYNLSRRESEKKISKKLENL
jgi:thymidylate synthase ThyX